MCNHTYYHTSIIKFLILYFFAIYLVTSSLESLATPYSSSVNCI